MKRIILLALFSITLLGQSKDPYAILEKVKNRLNNINDYSVDVTINVDVAFMKMPDSKAKIYFKKPDKFKFKSEGFAMLPKQGLNFTPVIFLKDDYDAIYLKSDILNTTEVDIIKIIPHSDSSDIILSTLWIDKQTDVIKKVESTTRNSGNIKMEFQYSNMFKFGLPDVLKFSFSLKNVRLPNMSPKSVDDKKQMTNDKTVEGIVTIKYLNYVVNKGLDDKIFSEK